MTDREDMVGNLPLQYFDGPDYCTVKDATGGDFALTVQPELMKIMEDALRSAARTDADVAVKPLEWTECRSMWFQASMCPRYEINPAVPSGYRLTYAGLRIDAPAEGGAFETVEAAKAAAQADYEQRIRSAIAALPAPGGKEVTEEQIAREICLSYGRDPDEPSDIMEMCDANDRPVPTWRIYEEQAHALLSTFTITRKSEERS